MSASRRAQLLAMIDTILDWIQADREAAGLVVWDFDKTVNHYTLTLTLTLTRSDAATPY